MKSIEEWIFIKAFQNNLIGVEIQKIYDLVIPMNKVSLLEGLGGELEGIPREQLFLHLHVFVLFYDKYNRIMIIICYFNLPCHTTK